MRSGLTHVGENSKENTSNIAAAPELACQDTGPNKKGNLCLQLHREAILKSPAVVEIFTALLILHGNQFKGAKRDIKCACTSESKCVVECGEGKDSRTKKDIYNFSVHIRSGELAELCVFPKELSMKVKPGGC